MLETGTYPHGPAAVELRETHISWVFIAGNLVYKVKKPLVLPFLDYGTVERRRWLCREEVRLNRRLAPDIYIGVVAIVQREEGLGIEDEHDIGAIEFAVEMRRIDEDRSLVALAARSEIGPGHLERVGARLARFHLAAPPVSGEAVGVKAQMAPIEANLETLAGFVGGPIEPDALRSARLFTQGFVRAKRQLIEARGRAGWVRECHGDIRAEHVIVPRDGDVYAFDCIEFDPALREIDVAADLAFLVMDLTWIGCGDILPSLVDSYKQAGGEPGSDSLLAFFAAYRAWIRTVVACVREDELDPGDPDRAILRSEAGRLFLLGRRFAWRARKPLVVVICGVAASGKTTLAQALSELSGWRHLSSDETRKQLAGIAPAERGPQSIYSRTFTDRTYRELGLLAASEIAAGRGVIVDATFHRRSDRDAFRSGLGGSAEVVFAECRPPREVLVQRAQERRRKGDSVSDADAAIVLRQLDELEPLLEIPEELRETLVGALDRDELAGRVELLVSSVQAREESSAG